MRIDLSNALSGLRLVDRLTNTMQPRSSVNKGKGYKRKVVEVTKVSGVATRVIMVWTYGSRWKDLKEYRSSQYGLVGGACHGSLLAGITFPRHLRHPL